MFYFRIAVRIIGNFLAFVMVNGIALAVVGGMQGIFYGGLCGIVRMIFLLGPSTSVLEMMVADGIYGGILATMVGGIAGGVIGIATALVYCRHPSVEKPMNDMMVGSARGSIIGAALGALSGILFSAILNPLLGILSPSWALSPANNSFVIVEASFFFGINTGFIAGACSGALMRCSGVEQATLRRVFVPFGSLAPGLIAWLTDRHDPVETGAAEDNDRA